MCLPIDLLIHISQLKSDNSEYWKQQTWSNKFTLCKGINFRNDKTEYTTLKKFLRLPNSSFKLYYIRFSFFLLLPCSRCVVGCLFSVDDEFIYTRASLNETNTKKGGRERESKSQEMRRFYEEKLWSLQAISYSCDSDNRQHMIKYEWKWKAY